MATVSFEEATRVYAKSDRPAVDRLTLDIADGEFLVLVGPSGCGKSTSLRMLAGLEDVDEGVIRIGARDVTELAPKERDIAMVFQNYALYPHMSVAENMGFALKIAGVRRADIRSRVAEAANILDLRSLLDRKPGQLSGGQRQRVAMGRAIVRSPQVFLMDEPLSNLDAKLRVSTRTQIAALQRRLGVTTMYVTHDQSEAMTMGDRVAVLRDGVLQQVDAPRELYARPANAFVAGFIGSPAMNLLPAAWTSSGLQIGSATISLPQPAATGAGPSRSVQAGFRPESLQVVAPGDGFAVTVNVVEELGSDAFVYASFAGNDADTISAGHDVVARVDPRVAPNKGATLHLRVRPGELHLFDAETGARVE